MCDAEPYSSVGSVADSRTTTTTTTTTTTFLYFTQNVPKVQLEDMKRREMNN